MGCGVHVCGKQVLGMARTPVKMEQSLTAKHKQETNMMAGAFLAYSCSWPVLANAVVCIMWRAPNVNRRLSNVRQC